MSRSCPTANNPNPSTRWFEWRGSTGVLQYFDKEKKENIVMKDGFSFLVLDQLSTVVGYNSKKKDGIHSNEVRDVRSETLVVKYFKSGVIAEGFWAAIKKDVAFEKGAFACSCYIAYKDVEALKIGNIKFSGCALGPWFDFVKNNRAALNEKAVVIRAGEKDTSGSVDFIPPVFSIKDTAEATNKVAIDLDRELQEFLKGYFSRTRTEQVAQPEHEEEEDAPPPVRGRGEKHHDPDLDSEDIPF